jgi:hypothetical protein
MGWPITICSGRASRRHALPGPPPPRWNLSTGPVAVGLEHDTAAQAGILGNNWDIPGFRWYDNASGVGCASCRDRCRLQRDFAGRIGLLRGGSAILICSTASALALLRWVHGRKQFRKRQAAGLSSFCWPAHHAVIALSPGPGVSRPARQRWSGPASPIHLLGALYEIANSIIFAKSRSASCWTSTGAYRRLCSYPASNRPPLWRRQPPSVPALRGLTARSGIDRCGALCAA